MRWIREQGRPRYTYPFFAAYFFYYAAYCIFSSYIVLYLTARSCSAATCGILTSLTLLANLLMEPVGGYLTDTFLSIRRYLMLCIAVIAALCLFCTLFSDRLLFLLTAMVLTAGISYPFSQMMDAWVSLSHERDPKLIYSRIRAGGSLGFALMSVLAGYYFKHYGWDTYFLVQLALFLIMLPFLWQLPETRLGNSRREKEKKEQLSFGEAFLVAMKQRDYRFFLLVSTLYWFSHRPVGSYLSLIVAGRGGDAGSYGNVCGVGAVVEFLSLLLFAGIFRKREMKPAKCLTAAVVTNLLRPLCLFLFPGIGSLYAGQILQSISFALFYSAGVECFAKAADERIRSFSISFGLTFSSVAGTILANLAGGWLCDLLGTERLVLFSLLLALGNGGVCFFGGKKKWTVTWKKWC